MNAFRLSGDVTHILSVLLLVYTILTRKSSAGISFKTQSLYAVVFLTRYLGDNSCGLILTIDLFWNYSSLYIFSAKIFFVVSSLYILYLLKYSYKSTQDSDIDSFQIQYVLVLCVVCSIGWHYQFSIQEVSSQQDLSKVGIMVVEYLDRECGHRASNLPDF